MRGPKPTPTRLKLVRGNPGKRPLPKGEPQPRVCLPPCPRWLSLEAKREWRSLGPKLRAAGIMTELDGTALALLCQTWARWVEAEAKVTELGAVVEGSHGQLMRSPYTRISAQAADQLLRLLVEFGMTPSSRSRVHGLAPASESDEVEAWINGKP